MRTVESRDVVLLTKPNIFVFVCLFVYLGDVTIVVAVVVSKEIPNTWQAITNSQRHSSSVRLS